MGESTTVTVMEAAGKTLEELQSLSSGVARWSFELVHEEDPTDPRPLVRILRFPNLTQAMEFAKLFDPGDHRAVWFTYPHEITDVFDQPVCMSVVFEAKERPAIDHGTDDMREVVRNLKSS